MSFLRGAKRRRKFNVELTVTSLSDVPLINAVIFAKVRLLEGGSFESYTCHRPVISYKVDFIESTPEAVATSGAIVKCPRDVDHPPAVVGVMDSPAEECSVGEQTQPFVFPCRISTDERTGELEQCRCKISLRKEDRGGRAPQRLGFVVLNLSEFAAWGSAGMHKSILLEGYSGQRQNNSRVNVFVKMTHQGQDPLFKVPNSIVGTAVDEAQLNPADRKAPSGHLPVGEYAEKKSGLTADGFDTPNKKLSESHFLSHQPNPNYHLPHYFDDRPTSSGFYTPSSSAVGRDAFDLTELRSSWHGGASNGVTPRYEFNSLGRVGGASMTGANQSNTDVVGSGGGHSLQHLSTAHAMKGGLAGMGGGSVADRIQKTRRDASGVIDEVLAETSALLAVDSHANASTALSWDGIGGEDSGYDFHVEDEDSINSTDAYSGKAKATEAPAGPAIASDKKTHSQSYPADDPVRRQWLDKPMVSGSTRHNSVAVGTAVELTPRDALVDETRKFSLAAAQPAV